MGRELKRVALDFDWPLHMPWKGYMNPYGSQTCRACDGSGLNPATKRIYDAWYNNGKNPELTRWCHNITQDEVQALIDAGRLMDFTHRPRTKDQEEQLKAQAEAGGSSYWLKGGNGYVPTAAEVNEWSRNGLGHDAVNHHVCVEARAKRLGVYGLCLFCRGEGEIWHTAGIKQLSEEWEGYAPPDGNGYQMWETVSEGSPISPVFKSPEKLAQWMVENDTSVTMGTSYDQWMRFIVGPGWALSFVSE
jgi:hypothetical protein